GTWHSLRTLPRRLSTLHLVHGAKCECSEPRQRPSAWMARGTRSALCPGLSTLHLVHGAKCECSEPRQRPSAWMARGTRSALCPGALVPCTWFMVQSASAVSLGRGQVPGWHVALAPHFAQALVPCTWFMVQSASAVSLGRGQVPGWHVALAPHFA